MKQRNIYYFLIIVLAGITLTNSCRKNGIYTNYSPVTEYNGTIYDYLKSDPADFQYMLLVFQKAGLTGLLQQQDSVTIFLPTDQSLISAMNEYNVYRSSQGLPQASVNDIDSSSWRSILTPYLFHGAFYLKDFEGQDGLTINSMALRPMHGKVIKNNASGVTGLGAETIQFSYENGSRFNINWISTNVFTPDIQAKNGIIHILENRHILGFNYFINKAKAPQNIYSENKTYATGQLTDPKGLTSLWSFYDKPLTAVNNNTVECEAADMLSDGYLMWLTVDNNDSVTVQAAPSSSNQTIQNDGVCFFDPVNYQFVLNYSFTDNTGKYTISETIRYIAIREK